MTKNTKVSIDFLRNGVRFGTSSVHGLGVFAMRDFKKDEVLEVCPCLDIHHSVIAALAALPSHTDAGFTDLRDYLFDPKKTGKSNDMILPMGCAMATPPPSAQCIGLPVHSWPLALACRRLQHGNFFFET